MGSDNVTPSVFEPDIRRPPRLGTRLLAFRRFFSDDCSDRSASTERRRPGTRTRRSRLHSSWRTRRRLAAEGSRSTSACCVGRFESDPRGAGSTAARPPQKHYDHGTPRICAARQRPTAAAQPETTHNDYSRRVGGLGPAAPALQSCVSASGSAAESRFFFDFFFFFFFSEERPASDVARFFDGFVSVGGGGGADGSEGGKWTSRSSGDMPFQRSKSALAFSWPARALSFHGFCRTDGRPPPDAVRKSRRHRGAAPPRRLQAGALVLGFQTRGLVARP